MNSKTLAGVQAQLDASAFPGTTYTVRVIAKNGQSWSYETVLTRDAAQELIDDELDQSIVKEVVLTANLPGGATATSRYVK